ncbi:TraB/GumN family protein [Luteimonas rhizosphaerae]|uniref:calcium-binding protein n=1 Tax=Luteimonas sp. 4-12 TaxID=2027406 RepID=UPI001304664D|nr:calcium-binding protein [Luteimonas sp. 4-12]
MITTTRRSLARLAGGLCVLAASWTATANWRSDALHTLVREGGDHRLVILGEMHGTREVPLLAGDLVEHWSTASPVLLALEIPAGEHPALRDTVAGGATDALIDGLRRRAWWALAPAQNDGRRSEDALALVQRVGALRRAGRDVAILPFDPRDRRCVELDNCDAAMAHVIRRAHAALAGGRVVVITGNVHAMRQRPRNAPALFPQRPMAAHLRDLAPVSIEISAAHGAFWACVDEAPCGAVTAETLPREGGRQSDDAPFDYRLVLPVFTPIRQVGAPERSLST